MSSNVTEILSIGKQLQGLVEALPAAITTWVEFLDKMKRRKEAHNVEHVLDRIRVRLFTRYELIHQFEDIVREGSLPQDRFDELTARLSKRMDYLKKFDEEIPEMITKIGNPSLAADIRTITTKSIELYGKIENFSDKEEIVALAPRIVPVVKDIARILESASDELRS